MPYQGRTNTDKRIFWTTGQHKAEVDVQEVDLDEACKDGDRFNWDRAEMRKP